MSSFFVFVVWCDMFGLLCCDFRFAGFACDDRVFLKFNRLTCHGRLVAGKLYCLEAESVHRNVHAVLDHDDVADMQVVVMEGLQHAVSQHTALEL